MLTSIGSSVAEAVRSAVAKALQLEDVLGADEVTYVKRVEWGDKASSHRFVGEEGWADLLLGVVVAKGLDETRYEYDPDTETNTPSTGGQREFSVSVQMCRHSQDFGEETMGTAGGKLRTRMRRKDVLKILNDSGVAMVLIGPTINGSYPDHNGRKVSCAVTDVRFRCVEVDTDDSPGSSDWIGSAEGTGEYAGGAKGGRDGGFDTAE
jgi:hypothetical protein